jgi:hypothetical protein
MSSLVSACLLILLGVWGVWLLATDDPDGGRHPMGALMLGAVIVVGLLWAASLARDKSRKRPNSRA